ncbi:hypothetical protein HO173_009304 [Letharia columbiana]|uniref:Uncharacterized protein n=1 Tax=Letharia columbiana TaxID=112416 RepID=A0A8H6FPQ1_9LECA|nr:uncharacterized protein HO173_009304 [Letharia columbiana]KAF6232425.1 hypothetical protein HO173_009304 [Letharia columbiana]
MALITSSVQCLPMASGYAHSLPLKLGLTLWSGCQRVTSFRSTWTALSGLSNPPHSWNQQNGSAQSLGRPRHFHCNAQLLMAAKTTPPLPQILLRGIRRLHSEVSGKDPENFTQRPRVIAGDKFSALVWSSSPMPNNIQIILDGKTATISGSSNERATKADATSPNTPSQNSAEFASSDQSSSNKDNPSSDHFHGFFDFLLRAGVISILAICIYGKGRKRGAQDLTAQLPDGKIFTDREGLRKEEEELKQITETFMVFHPCGKCDGEFNVHHDILRNKRKELAEKVEGLDRKELEHVRQRAMVLEGKLKRQKASIEMDRARESPREAVKAGILPDETYTETVDGLYSETPSCSGEKADPPMEQAEMFPSANLVAQVPSQGPEMNETPRTVRHRENSMAHTKPDTRTTGPPRMKTGSSPASHVVLRSLSADYDAACEEMGQIKRAKEALETRERELEAQDNDRKERVQELNAPKSDQMSSIASGMLLGSALAFGVTMMMSVVET